MKRSFWIGVAIAAAGLSLGAAGAYRGACSVAPMAKSEIAREANPEVDQRDSSELVAGNTRFAVDAYKAIARTTPEKNLLLSPYSISLALAMATAGAGGQTATEMAAAMHFTLPQPRLHRALDALDRTLTSRAGQGVLLQMADSIWAMPSFQFEKAFLDTLARSYGTGVRLVDFAGDPDGSRRRMNRWVADATSGNIRDLLPRDSIQRDTPLVLLNAVYFRARWSTPFEVDHTRTATFRRLDGSETATRMMSHAFHGTACSRTGDYDAVELPYQGEQIALDIVVPGAGTFRKFEAGLTTEKLAAIFSALDGASILVLSVPRFQFAGETFSLRETLQSLGMARAFGGQADFSPLGAAPRGRLSLGDVLQQASIAVDEEGAEASAATAVTFAVRAAPPSDEPVVITIDHPFLFFVRDLPTGTILFEGRVVDPGAATESR